MMKSPREMGVHQPFIVLMACFIARAAPAVAQPISINNAGFEANPVASNCFQGFIPTGWTLYDPSGIYDGAVDAVGGLNTEPGGPHFNNGAPEGDHVALVFLDGDTGGGPMGLTQVLDRVMEADTQYAMTVQVGNIASGQGPPPCDVFGFFDLDGFPGYRVQLLAGGIVVAEDANTMAGSIPEGEFALSAVTLSVGETHPQLGTPLEVRLINLNTIGTPEDPGIEVDFDDVRLHACHRTGDLNSDSFIDADDVAIFVEVLTETDTDPSHVEQADMNCSQTTDALDIPRFVTVILD